MRKSIFVALILVALSSFNACAAETSLLEMRNKFFQEAQELKAIAVNPKNVVLINSMWDSCLMTMAQLDAYFSMLGIYNSVTNADAAREAADYIYRWLNEIKRINDLNIKSLRSVLQLNEPNVNTHMDRLRIYYTELNSRIDSERKKVSLLSGVKSPK